MKFKFGPTPESEEFNPEADGWVIVREPGPGKVQLVAFPIAILFCFALVYAYHRLVGLHTLPQPLWKFTPHLMVIGMIIAAVHELIHGVFTPGCGLSNRTSYGIWPRKFIFYVFYDGEITKYRFLLIQLAPFLILSVLPFSMELIMHWGALPIWVLTFFNTLLSLGDLVGAPITMFQIPKGATVRLNGWWTYWRQPR